jgi:trimethylamine:corrinoid methyltransferase-like protein
MSCNCFVDSVGVEEETELQNFDSVRNVSFEGFRFVECLNTSERLQTSYCRPISCHFAMCKSLFLFCLQRI